MDDGFLPVKVAVPLAQYKRLYAEATAARMTVAELIMRRASPKKRGGPRPGSGRPSKYTAEVGAGIAEARALSMSWPEISSRFGVAADTARKYLTRYENEKRESAESRTAT